jgi:hypothetical protein
VINKNILQTIGDKEMDRKDFLKYSGLVLLGLVGLKTVASLLNQPENKLTVIESSKNVGRGFGSGKYGV